MSAVRQVVPLGAPPWPTVDPFLFCVHHVDDYPAGRPTLGPDPALLAGRPLGQDFGHPSGWSMYHGQVVPGFPQHPHRGFETVTYVRRGLIDHSDSLGATARFGRGDVQWLTAGRGIVHCEMFPLVDPAAGNPLELFQLWLNLPAADKMVEPHFAMLWGDRLPVVRAGPPGQVAEVTVVAGRFGHGGDEPPPPPPNSWASRADADVAIWNVRLEAGASVELPAAMSDRTVRVAYVYGDGGVLIDGEPIAARHAAVLDATSVITCAAGSATEVLVLQGCPIGEPVAQHGPFVMNDREGIAQAFEDYRRTAFGGWPWPVDDPVHAASAPRFARHADGTSDVPADLGGQAPA